MNLYFIEKFAKALEKMTKTKLDNAKKRQLAAANGLRAAQRKLEATNTDLRLAQAGILAQLTRLNAVGEDVTSEMSLNEAKATKLKALITDDFSD
jgi:hypothetical protein